MLIWAIIVQHDYTVNPPGKLDWEGSPRFGKGFGLCKDSLDVAVEHVLTFLADIMLNTGGNILQNFLYWTVGSVGEGTSELTRFAGLLRGIESFGQCASFGINSSKFSRKSQSLAPSTSTLTSRSLGLDALLTCLGVSQPCTPLSSTSSSGACLHLSLGSPFVSLERSRKWLLVPPTRAPKPTPLHRRKPLFLPRRRRSGI